MTSFILYSALIETYTKCNYCVSGTELYQSLLPGDTLSGAVCLLGKSEIPGSTPALAFKFQRNKMFLPCSLIKIRYCGEPPWPRGSVLGLRPPGLEFHHLTILRRFSLPSLAYYVHKCGLKPHSFILFISMASPEVKLLSISESFV